MRITPELFETSKRQDLTIEKMRRLIELAAVVPGVDLAGLAGDDKQAKTLADALQSSAKAQAVKAYIEGLKKGMASRSTQTGSLEHGEAALPRAFMAETGLVLRPARIILTANNVRLFDHLEKVGLTAAATARVLGTNPRATKYFWMPSPPSAWLRRPSDGMPMNRCLAPLVSGRPGYQGDILRHYSSLWDNWSGLDRVLKTGKPNRVSRDHTSFIMGMHNIASLKRNSLMRAIPMAGLKRVLDLGGGPGTYAMAFAAQGLDVTLMDYPETLKIARRVIRESALPGRVRLRPATSPG